MDFILSNYPNSGLLASHSVRAIHEFHDVFVANAEAFPLKDQVLTLEELKEYPIMMLDRKSTTSEFLHSMFQRSHLDLVPVSYTHLCIPVHEGPDLRPLLFLCLLLPARQPVDRVQVEDRDLIEFPQPSGQSGFSAAGIAVYYDLHEGRFL